MQEGSIHKYTPEQINKFQEKKERYASFSEFFELYNREREAWKSVFGVDVDVKPLPEYVDSEVQRKIEFMGLALRYIPAIDLGNREDLRRIGVESYVRKLWGRYPNWARYESLSDRAGADHNIPRNLNQNYWELAKGGNVDFPVLLGQWLAVETVEKPMAGITEHDNKYQRTPLADKLGFTDNRIKIPVNTIDKAIDREKQSVLSDVGLADYPLDLRSLEVLEYNLMANREGWGKTNIYEWTNTKCYVRGRPLRLICGYAGNGGAAAVSWQEPNNPSAAVGYRVAIVLGSGNLDL